MNTKHRMENIVNKLLTKKLPMFLDNFTNSSEVVNNDIRYIEGDINTSDIRIDKIRKKYGCYKNFGRHIVNISDSQLEKQYTASINSIPHPTLIQTSKSEKQLIDFDSKKINEKNTNADCNMQATNELQTTTKLQTSSPRKRVTNLIIAGRFLIGDLISSGTYSNVYKCIDMHTSEKCVIKEFVDGNTIFCCETIRELIALSTLRDCPEIVGVKSIISAIDVNEISTRFYAILTYHTKTLNDVYEEYAKHDTLRRELAQIYCRDIARGLSYMHSCGIAHCDLKPANILITATNNAIIADFSLVLFAGHTHNTGVNCAECYSRRHNVLKQTIGYRAPELLFEIENYDPLAIDIWSFGCIAVEMHTGVSLFYCIADKPVEYFKSIIRELGPFDPNLYGLTEPIKPTSAAGILLGETNGYYETYLEGIERAKKRGETTSNIPRPHLNTITDSDTKGVLSACLSYSPEQRPSAHYIAAYYEYKYGKKYLAGEVFPLDSFEQLDYAKNITKRMNTGNKIKNASYEYFIRTVDRFALIRSMIDLCENWNVRKEGIYSAIHIHDMFFCEITKIIDLRLQPIIIPTVGSFSFSELCNYVKITAHLISALIYEHVEIKQTDLIYKYMDSVVLSKMILYIATLLKFDFGICERVFMKTIPENEASKIIEYLSPKSCVDQSIYDVAAKFSQ